MRVPPLVFHTAGEVSTYPGEVASQDAAADGLGITSATKNTPKKAPCQKINVWRISYKLAYLGVDARQPRGLSDSRR